MTYILVAAVAIIIGIVGTYLSMRERFEILRRLDKLEIELSREMYKRTEIESVNGLKNHYSWNTKAAMMDIAANSLDLEFEISEMTARLQTIRTIANSISKDPSKYDPERPSGNRPASGG